MLRKLITYTIVVACLFIDGQWFGLISRLGLSKGPFLAILLFGVYLFMLFLEVKSQREKKRMPRQVVWTASVFSFWIGVIWGLLMSFSAGFHYKSPFLFVMAGYLFVGIVFALIGSGISMLLLKIYGTERQLKKPSASGNKETPEHP